MPTELKVKQVAEIEERLQRAVITIGLDYRGLTVSQMRNLRLALRSFEPSIEMRVVKNTLVKRAAENAGQADVAQLTKQATALVFGYEEQINPPKGIAKFLSESRLEIPIHGGYMDGALITPAEIADLATIPSRLELMAQIAGGLNNPITGIAAALQAVFRDTAAIIEARAVQLAEQGGDTADADDTAENVDETDSPSDADGPVDQADAAHAPDAATESENEPEPATDSDNSGDGSGDDSGETADAPETSTDQAGDTDDSPAPADETD
jgi:large subunit ribosomal protein L10